MSGKVQWKDRAGKSGSYPCEICGKPTRIVDSRPVRVKYLGLPTIYRRRTCSDGHRFTTYEVPAEMCADPQIEFLNNLLEKVRSDIRDGLAEFKGFNLSGGKLGEQGGANA